MNINTKSLQSTINFIWTVADDGLINRYFENQYQNVIPTMAAEKELNLANKETLTYLTETIEE